MVLDNYLHIEDYPSCSRDQILGSATVYKPVRLSAQYCIIEHMQDDTPRSPEPRGRPDENSDLSVAINTEAYEAIAKASDANMPSETVGILAGMRYQHAGRTLVSIGDVRSIGPLPQHYAPEQSEEQLASLAAGMLEAVGWFYADPGIGIFPPRAHLDELRHMIAPGTELFLLVNPATRQGAFYRWLDQGLRRLEGFYEALPARMESAITWEGVVTGATAWLAAAGMNIIAERLDLPGEPGPGSDAVSLSHSTEQGRAEDMPEVTAAADSQPIKRSPTAGPAAPKEILTEDQGGIPAPEVVPPESSETKDDPSADSLTEVYQPPNAEERAGRMGNRVTGPLPTLEGEPESGASVPNEVSHSALRIEKTDQREEPRAPESPSGASAGPNYQVAQAKSEANEAGEAATSPSASLDELDTRQGDQDIVRSSEQQPNHGGTGGKVKSRRRWLRRILVFIILLGIASAVLYLYSRLALTERTLSALVADHVPTPTGEHSDVAQPAQRKADLQANATSTARHSVASTRSASNTPPTATAHRQPSPTGTPPDLSSRHPALTSGPTHAPTAVPTNTPQPQLQAVPSKTSQQSTPESTPTKGNNSSPGFSYVVQSGDTLGGIALRFDTKVPVIMTANSLTSTTIRIGQVLFIPTTR